MKKILFPFLKKKRYSFLIKKWWFRSVIALYIIAFIIAPFVLWLWYVNTASDWCYNEWQFLDIYGNHPFNISKCSQIARNAWITGIPIAILGWLVIHYLIQIIFFKVIIDYIVLGRKK